METILDRLELFWESEVARAGEPGADGWAAWEAAGYPETSPGSSRVVPRSSKTTDPYTRWAAEELMQDQSLQFSARSSDEDDE